MIIAFALASAVAALSPPTGPSLAEALPDYNVSAYCGMMAKSLGGNPAIMVGCVEQERVAKDGLAAEWKGLPEGTQAHCDGIARSIGGSYDILEGCVSQERAKVAPTR